MTEVAVRQSDAELEPARPVNALAVQQSAFTQWIHDARQLAVIAESLARTSFVPKAFVGKPAEITACILAGQEVGFSPMASLRAIDVIEGKPGMSAIALRALVQSHGHDIWTVESTASRCIVKGRRKGTERVETSTWTLDRAKTFELTGKANWKKQPTSMLLARATSEVARLIAADVILGMPYSTEELQDEVESVEPTSPAAPPGEEKPVRRATRRKPLEPLASAEPDLEPAAQENSEPTAEAVDADDDERPESGMASAKQHRHMHALWRDLGYAGDDNRESRLTVTAKLLGLTEPLESSSELTYDDAEVVIEGLKSRKASLDQGEPS